jgi:hypothetical protein
LQNHHLELPLSYSRPYCQLDHAPFAANLKVPSAPAYNDRC